jgi:hypothetical protein
LTVGVTDVTAGVAEARADIAGGVTVVVGVTVVPTAGGRLWGDPPTPGTIGKVGGPVSGSAPLPSLGTWNVVMRPFF